MNLLIFLVYLVGKDTFIALPEHQELFFYFYYIIISLTSDTFLTYVMLISNLLDTLDWPSLSLLDSLSLMASLLLCPVDTSFLDLSRPSTLSPPLREYTRALLQFPLLEPWLEKSFKVVSWEVVELHLFCFLSPFPSLLGVQCFENQSHFFFCCIVFLYYCCCFRQSKSSPCYSILIQRGIL